MTKKPFDPSIIKLRGKGWHCPICYRGLRRKAKWGETGTSWKDPYIIIGCRVRKGQAKCLNCQSIFDINSKELVNNIDNLNTALHFYIQSKVKIKYIGVIIELHKRIDRVEKSCSTKGDIIFYD